MTREEYQIRIARALGYKVYIPDTAQHMHLSCIYTPEGKMLLGSINTARCLSHSSVTNSLLEKYNIDILKIVLE